MGEDFSHIAPCGLDCSRCAEFKRGEIGRTSARLLELMGNYGRLAALKAELNPAFKDYQGFQQILSTLASPTCGGCRQPDVNCPIDCAVRTCLPSRKVDFCFNCPEYPCITGTQGIIGERWRQNNDRMKEIGVEGYNDEQKKQPRYR